MSDLILEAWVSALIEMAKLRPRPAASARWTPGRKLKVLFAGYNGARNTGEEVRVEEMIRQFQQVLGAENINLTVLTLSPEYTSGYFNGATQIKLPHIFPPFLSREVPQHDVAVACCGAMFKSKFSNVPTAMMIEALGIASAQDKLTVAYGGEAGYMDAALAGMCRRYCSKTLMIVRNKESRSALGKLGISSELGADTAWTFEPRSAEFGRTVLRDAGWDGKQPVLVVCPINPFCWPVKASFFKATARALTGAYRDSHYRSIYFHNAGPKAEAAYRHYFASICAAVETFRRRRGVFPVLVGMERLDADPCAKMSARLGDVPVFTSDQYNAFELVSILRCADLLVSSRYHAVVTSMPGLVPSAGVSMDERIPNLMRERGHSDLALSAEDSELEAKLVATMGRLINKREAISNAIGRTVVRNLQAMAGMGVRLEQYVRERYPDFPVGQADRGWRDYLPPLSDALTRLVESHGVAAAPHRS